MGNNMLGMGSDRIMRTKKLKAISLFSGAGGMDIGVSEAGFDTLACIEQDIFCCETLRHNFKREGKKTKVIEDDIRNIDPDSLMNELGIKRGEVDLLYGGSPCQSFSQIGKMESLKDERGLLLFQMIRFAKAIKPKAIFIEQVKGLLNARDYNGHAGGVLDMLLSDLKDLGYQIKWKVINAADYGVTQLRKRVFVVAVRSGIKFDFPPPTHGSQEFSLPLFSVKPYFTVGEAIKGLGTPEKKNEGAREDSHIDVTPAGDKLRIHGVPEGSFLAAQIHLPKEQVQNLTKKDTTKYLRLSRSRPANTLRGGEIFFHPIENRYLTPREYMRIHGYPDNYVLKGPIRSRSGRVKNLDQHRQVANSVPPPVAKAIANNIAKVLKCRKYSKSLVTA